MSKVNLDAMIPREDFVYTAENNYRQQKFENLTMGHLLSTGSMISIYHLLKKPDFQRETNEWDKQRIANLIEAFIEGSFIPSVILWQNQTTNNIFVIDGAHRLSALIAYFNDDYGDREISSKFYGYTKIPQAEIDLANETRDYINKKIGSFSDVMSQTNPDYTGRMNGLKMSYLDIQLIQGDVKKAEDSFFKINQQGVILSPTEKELCKSRKRPSCITTRAIIKGGTGHQYWSTFEAQNQQKIKACAEELNRLLFLPPYRDDTKSIIRDHPLCGSITTAIAVIFDMVKIVRGANEIIEIDETDGNQTLYFLQVVRKLVWIICSEQAGSLGLVPSIYFYNSVGKFMPSAFLGFVQLLAEKQNDSNFFATFTKNRKRLEEFLISYKVLVTQIIRKYGSKERSYRHLKGYFLRIIQLLDEEINEEEMLGRLRQEYDFLNPQESEVERPKSKAFSKEAKISLTIKEDLSALSRCKICGGYLHPMSKSFDHNIDKKLGGGGEIENAQTTHYYCNNSKDKLIALGIYKPIR